MGTVSSVFRFISGSPTNGSMSRRDHLFDSASGALAKQRAIENRTKRREQAEKQRMNPTLRRFTRSAAAPVETDNNPDIVDDETEVHATVTEYQPPVSNAAKRPRRAPSAPIVPGGKARRGGKKAKNGTDSGDEYVQLPGDVANIDTPITAVTSATEENKKKSRARTATLQAKTGGKGKKDQYPSVAVQGTADPLPSALQQNRLNVQHSFVKLQQQHPNIPNTSHTHASRLTPHRTDLNPSILDSTSAITAAATTTTTTTTFSIPQPTLLQNTSLIPIMQNLQQLYNTNNITASVPPIPSSSSVSASAASIMNSASTNPTPATTTTTSLPAYPPEPTMSTMFTTTNFNIPFATTRNNQNQQQPLSSTSYLAQNPLQSMVSTNTSHHTSFASPVTTLIPKAFSTTPSTTGTVQNSSNQNAITNNNVTIAPHPTNNTSNNGSLHLHPQPITIQLSNNLTGAPASNASHQLLRPQQQPPQQQPPQQQTLTPFTIGLTPSHLATQSSASMGLRSIIRSPFPNALPSTTMMVKSNHQTGSILGTTFGSGTLHHLINQNNTPSHNNNLVANNAHLHHFTNTNTPQPASTDHDDLLIPNSVEPKVSPTVRPMATPFANIEPLHNRSTHPPHHNDNTTLMVTPNHRHPHNHHHTTTLNNTPTINGPTTTTSNPTNSFLLPHPTITPSQSMISRGASLAQQPLLSTASASGGRALQPNFSVLNTQPDLQQTRLSQNLPATGSNPPQLIAHNLVQQSSTSSRSGSLFSQPPK